MKIRKVKTSCATVAQETDKYFCDKSHLSNRANSIGLEKALSHSQINLYLNCHRAYYFRYIKKIPMEIIWNSSLIFGSAIHKSFEVILNSIMKNEFSDNTIIKSNEVLKRYVVGKIEEHKKELTKRNINEIKEQIKLCSKIVENWTEKNKNKIKPTGVEKLFSVCILDSKSNIYIPFIGYIDFIDEYNSKTIYDFKVTKRQKTNQNAKDSLQLALYSAIMDINNAGFISCPYPDITKKQFKPDSKTVEVIETKSMKDWAINVFLSVSRDIINDNERKEFSPCNPENWNCNERFCDYWDICRGKEKNQISVPKWMNVK